MEAAEILEGHGYRRMGGGTRGHVLAAPDLSHVAKVFPADDVAYLSLVRYALDHPSPHLPTVLHGPVEVEGGWAVFLERLEHLDDEYASDAHEHVGGYMLAVVNGDVRAGREPGPGRWGHDVEASLRAVLVPLCETLMVGHGFYPDDSDGNVLLGPDGRYVLSDVLCGRSGRPYAGRVEPPHDPDLDALLRPAGPRP